MPGERLLRLLGLVTAGGTIEPTMARICDVSVEVAAVSGAGIMLMAGDVPRGSLSTTDSVSETIEELQFTLGEGPCVDAYRHRLPVLEPDLRAPVVPRWPAFTQGAVAAGAAAIFGFPLQVGVTRLGALNLYRDTPGALSDDEHADASVMADLSARAVIDMQARASIGSIAPLLESGANLQLVVHQASGMVSAQLGVDVGEALVRLRAHAFSAGVNLADVAADVVDRRLRFDGTSAGEGGEPYHEPID